ncbi:MAG: ABC transporter ATP-binding protein [Granulosicoccaceae bacterium]
MSAQHSAADAAVNMALNTKGLTKHFGGIVATDNLDLNVKRGSLHALIGPNGAGKTTLISQLCGLLAPDSGQVFLYDQDITAVPPAKRVQRGLSRTFQITSVFPEFSAQDNVAFAAQAVAGHSYRFWRPVVNNKTFQQQAQDALARVGLSTRATVPASSLSHGERRQLEIAMVLAAKPKVLLLDEPMAGMGGEESALMVELLQSLKYEVTMLLVEHDMDAVFALADELSVLVYGRLIATGLPEDIRGNAEVQRAYLGATPS